MGANIHPEKPAEGSWTVHYGLPTDDLDIGDVSTQAGFEKDVEAIFKKTWLWVGRVEDFPATRAGQTGSYFTRELDFAKTSALITRAEDGQIRAFHNMCPHRGNKLVWDEHPGNEVSGACRMFSCKYHGWQFNPDGTNKTIAREGEFFNLDKAKYGLIPIHCDVWAGFIFINLDAEPRQSLREYLGEAADVLEGYPFNKLTAAYKYRSHIKCNWKPAVDGVMEILHAPYLHTKMSPEMVGVDTDSALATADAVLFKMHGEHRVASWNQVPPEVDQGSPVEELTRSGLFGPKDKPDIGLTEENLPVGVNPTRSKLWGVDSWNFFPNFQLLIWEGNYVLTFQYWPTGPGEHILENNIYFPEPKNASERLAQETFVVTNKEYAMQDINTYEATQRMYNSGVRRTFPISDQEVLIRHFHKIIDEYHARYDAAQAGNGE